LGIVDCHCDVLSRIWAKDEGLFSNGGQFDLQRARQSGVIVQFCSVFAPGTPDSSLRSVLNQIDKFYVELSLNTGALYLLKTFEDFQKHQGSGSIGAVLHLEGGEALGQDPGLLRVLHLLGLRSIGLTWNHRNLLADGVLDGASGGGLSRLGREVLRLAESLGVIVDLAHIAPRGFFDVLETVAQPVMVSHANTRRLCDHPRNLTDEQLASLASHGGIVGFTLVPEFISSDPLAASLDGFVDHLAYASELIGVEHIALGSDFDGTEKPVLKDVSEWPKLEEALQARGFHPSEIEKITQKNSLNFLEQVLR